MGSNCLYYFYGAVDNHQVFAKKLTSFLPLLQKLRFSQQIEDYILLG